MHAHTQVAVDKVVEKPKVVYVDVPQYTEKVVQKIVEKFVEVPVEKLVYQVCSMTKKLVYISFAAQLRSSYSSTKKLVSRSSYGEARISGLQLN